MFTSAVAVIYYFSDNKKSFAVPTANITAKAVATSTATNRAVLATASDSNIIQQ